MRRNRDRNRKRTRRAGPISRSQLRSTRPRPSCSVSVADARTTGRHRYGLPVPQTHKGPLTSGTCCAAATARFNETPDDRWSETLKASEDKQKGKITANQGALLDSIDQWDASFFGISRREAVSLDPQHRLLMTVTWEALEHAGLDPDQLRGSRTGVFVGMCSGDYLHQLTARERQQIDAYLGTGNAHGAAVGRLSYFLNWQGPSHRCRYGLLLLTDRRPLRRPKPAGPRLRYGGGGRREPDPGARTEHQLEPGGYAVSDGSLPCFFCRGGRVCAWRGMWRAAAQATLRRPGRRRPNRLPAAWLGRESGRTQQRADRPQRTGPTGRDPQRPGRRSAASPTISTISKPMARGPPWEIPIEMGALQRRVRTRSGPRTATASRLGQDQHRTPGRSGRDRRPDEGLPGIASRAPFHLICISNNPVRISTGTGRCRSPPTLTPWLRGQRRGVPASARSGSAAPTHMSWWKKHPQRQAARAASDHPASQATASRLCWSCRPRRPRRWPLRPVSSPTLAGSVPLARSLLHRRCGTRPFPAPTGTAGPRPAASPAGAAAVCPAGSDAQNQLATPARPVAARL